MRVFLAQYEAQGRLTEVLHSKIIHEDGRPRRLLDYVIKRTNDEAKRPMMRLFLDAGLDINAEVIRWSIESDDKREPDSGTLLHLSIDVGHPALMEFS